MWKSLKTEHRETYIMSDSTISTQKVRYKSFTYNTNLEWVGGKAGNLASKGKPGFRVASPPEFKGEEGVWSPEDLFVAAVNICTMTTFLSLASRKELQLVSYSSGAEGLLEFSDGSYRFTKVILHPQIRVKYIKDIGLAHELLESAHHKCLITNSISSEISIEPEISADE
jgi:organic hydroperoxide reductase OsmC/OhrA